MTEARSGARRVDAFSLVLPCRDEAGQIDSTVRGFVGALRAQAISFEVIIVNDASRDATGTIAERLAHELAEVSVVHAPASRGYGAALCRGFIATRHPWVGYVDADGQFSAQALVSALERLERGGDVVACYRSVRRDSHMRLLLGRVWRRLLVVSLGLRFKDVNCGLKLFPRRIAVAPALESAGALVSAELLLRALDDGLRVEEHGVPHHPRRYGRATGARPRVIARALVELARLLRRRAPRSKSTTFAPLRHG